MYLANLKQSWSHYDEDVPVRITLSNIVYLSFEADREIFCFSINNCCRSENLDQAVLDS